MDRVAKKNKKPVQDRDGLLVACFSPKERRNAELSYLLSIFFGPTVKTRCVGSSSRLASY
jgi:hypothetical protein